MKAANDCSRRHGMFARPSDATSASFAVAPSWMRRAALCLAAGLLAAGATPAQAQTTIHWSDFSKSTQVCAQQCVAWTSQWVSSCVGDCYDWTNCQPGGCCTDFQCMYPQTVCALWQSVPPCTTTRVKLPDGDLIDVQIEHGALGPEAIEFRLIATTPNVHWWKQIRTSGNGGPVWKVWAEPDRKQSWCNWPQAQTPNCNTQGEWTGVLLGESLIFSKAKLFGIHTDVYVLPDLSSQLSGGDRVTFTWVSD